MKNQNCILCSYVCQTGNIQQGYFNAMLLHKETVKPTHSLDCLNFHSSNMGRHLLIQPAHFHHDIPIVLMTSHLESTGRCAAERKDQFLQILKKMQDQSSQANVIFGGDTNLRDHEVTSVGGLPGRIVDVWQACGSPPDTKFTWDVQLNDNLDWRNKYKPKLRFDRLFLRAAQQRRGLTPSHLAFVGTDRLPGCQRFPSDHWGLWAELKSSSK